MDTIFIKGMQFYRPNEKSPEWIKGNIVIQRKELIEFLNTLENDTVRIDLKKSKEKGTLYLALNTFNPMKREENSRQPEKTQAEKDKEEQERLANITQDEQGNYSDTPF